jgi:hypothetical protein
MTSNINQLLSLTGFELAKLDEQFEAKYGYESDISITGDVTKLLALHGNKGASSVASEMEALGLAEAGAVFSREVAKLGERVDKTDWDNVIG